jgi:hypothetical protein
MNFARPVVNDHPFEALEPRRARQTLNLVMGENVAIGADFPG